MCKAHPILTTCDLQHQVERAEDLGLFDEPDDKFICGICKENLSDGEKVCTLATCGCTFHFLNLKQSLDQATLLNQKSSEVVSGIRNTFL